MSPNFFGTINANFNKAYKDSHVFFDQQYDSMDKTAYSLLSLAVVFSISVDAMLISSIVYTIVGIAKRRFLRTLAGFGACTLTGLLCTATNLSIKHLREDYYKPISKYAEKSKEFERGD
ncbi:MAG: hypothetical protein MJ200_04065 [Mycoplasmoidaceae bacterium]|nr:hypothetical protein [Mycoplasmoidaceae bacterium]